MAPRKKVETGTEVAVPPVEGELLPNLNLDKATGMIATVQLSGIGEIEQSYLDITEGRGKELMAGYAGTIDGNAAMKAFLKQCSTLRSALDRAHKEAKAPFLEATRAIDARLKECKEAVTSREEVVKLAIKTYEDKEAAEAAAAQATLEQENAKLREELAKYQKVTEDAGLTTPFIDRQVCITIQGRELSAGARALFGDSYAEVKTDENGVNYVLEVVLRRKEIQEI